MFEHRDPSGRRFQTFEVEASSFGLYEGARIYPGILIGRDIRSGESVEIGYRGYVATAYYNPMNRSFLVMVCRLSKTREAPVPGNERYLSARA